MYADSEDWGKSQVSKTYFYLAWRMDFGQAPPPALPRMKTFQ